MSERHKLLIEKLAELEQYNNSQGKPLFKLRKGKVMVKDIKKIDFDTVYNSATLLAQLHNISGSAYGWQLYDLICAYFTDEKKRERINAILNEK